MTQCIHGTHGRLYLLYSYFTGVTSRISICISLYLQPGLFVLWWVMASRTHDTR